MQEQNNLDSQDISENLMLDENTNIFSLSEWIESNNLKSCNLDELEGLPELPVPFFKNKSLIINERKPFTVENIDLGGEKKGLVYYIPSNFEELCCNYPFLQLLASLIIRCSSKEASLVRLEENFFFSEGTNADNLKDSIFKYLMDVNTLNEEGFNGIRRCSSINARQMVKQANKTKFKENSLDYSMTTLGKVVEERNGNKVVLDFGSAYSLLTSGISSNKNDELVDVLRPLNYIITNELNLSVPNSDTFYLISKEKLINNSSIKVKSSPLVPKSVKKRATSLKNSFIDKLRVEYDAVISNNNLSFEQKTKKLNKILMDAKKIANPLREGNSRVKKAVITILEENGLNEIKEYSKKGATPIEKSRAANKFYSQNKDSLEKELTNPSLDIVFFNKSFLSYEDNKDLDKHSLREKLNNYVQGLNEFVLKQLNVSKEDISNELFSFFSSG
jgi:hypothetical protein